MKESMPSWADFLSSYGDNREYGLLLCLSSNTHPLRGDVKSLVRVMRNCQRQTWIYETFRNAVVSPLGVVTVLVLV